MFPTSMELPGRTGHTLVFQLWKFNFKGRKPVVNTKWCPYYSAGQVWNLLPGSFRDDSSQASTWGGIEICHQPGILVAELFFEW